MFDEFIKNVHLKMIFYSVRLKFSLTKKNNNKKEIKRKKKKAIIRIGWIQSFLISNSKGHDIENKI